MDDVGSGRKRNGIRMDGTDEKERTEIREQRSKTRVSTDL
jgi:hypothetical protein